MATGKLFPYAIWAALFALFLRLDPSIHKIWRSSLQRFDRLRSTDGIEDLKALSENARSGAFEVVAAPLVPRITILSFDPFIAHVADFISPSELAHLKQLSAPYLSRSTVLYANGSKMESSERTSSTAYLMMEDDVLTSIRDRASKFQGFLAPHTVDIQVTSYQQGQQYTPHWDWFLEPDRTDQRLSTFFAIIEADCTDCGTQFPKLKVDWSKKDPRWCELVDCSKEVLTTRNIPGSAFFWENIDRNGKGRDEMLHAGLPAINGTKVGLNVWTTVELSRYQKYEGEGMLLQPQ